MWNTFPFRRVDSIHKNASLIIWLILQSSILLAQPGVNCAISARIVEQKAVRCANTTEGILGAEVTGATGAVTYYWEGGEVAGTTSVYSGLRAGTYTLIVSDEVGCRDTAQFTFQLRNAIVVSCRPLARNDVEGEAKGRAIIIFTGGTGKKQVVWHSGTQPGEIAAQTDTSLEIRNLTSKLYSFDVVDEQGCTASCEFVIPGPGCLIKTEVTTLVPKCKSARSGSITLSPRFGSPPYTYTWQESPGNKRDRLTNIRAGIYRVTVEDGLGCRDSMAISLEEPAALEANCIPTKPVSFIGGNNGKAKIAIQGGTPPFDVRVEGSTSTRRYFQPTPDTLYLDTLTTGNYSFEVKDKNGCIAFCDFFISEPPCTVNFSLATKNPACDGSATGVIETKVAGATQPFAFDWSVDSLDGKSGATNLLAGIYTIKITDSDGCESNTSVFLQNPSPLEIRCENPKGASSQQAADGRIALTLQGGSPPYQMMMDGPVRKEQAFPVQTGLDVIALLPGKYTVTVTDSNKCVSSCSFEIPVINCQLKVKAEVAPPVCTGDSSAIVSITTTGQSGDVSLSWNGLLLSGNRIEKLPAGTYFLQATDQIGCVDTLTVNISSTKELGLRCRQYTGTSNALATDGVARLSIDKGFRQVEWTISGPSDGTIRQKSDTDWDVSVLGVGVYEVLVKTAGNCLETCQFTIAVNTCGGQPDLQVWPEDTVVLKGQSLRLDVPASLNIRSLEWTPTQAVRRLSARSYLLTPVESTLYTISLTDDNGCVFTQKVYVRVRNQDGVFMPSAFSPNDDGNNDTYSVYCNEEVERILYFGIFNKWGEPVFTIENSTPDNPAISWDGTIRGQQAPSGAYACKLVIRRKGQPRDEVVTGVLQLIR